MADSITIFQEELPSIESYWRSIILFGRNVASYKFALSKSLLTIAPTGKNIVLLEELAEPFAINICKHLKLSPKQHTGSSSRFLDCCRQFNEGKITKQALLESTVRYGFNNVIDAFHNVSQTNIPIRFYEKDFQGKNKKIVLTDNLFKMTEQPQFGNLPYETEARWKLVETAWELGISRNMLQIQYDKTGNSLYIQPSPFRRKNVTSVRDALNGYQKGKCFYCFDNISIEKNDSALCDVDHFIPHMLQEHLSEVNLDAVWNLVLACSRCNRGNSGKFERIPTIKYLTRLHKRNEFLISSHHPLRETLIVQTGNTSLVRANFLKKMYHRAINYIPHRWETIQIGREIF